MPVSHVKLIERTSLLLGLMLLLSLLIKGCLLLFNVFPFNADEAVVALMARHILEGERPVFFYGQAYMGSLDAILVAITYLIIGQNVVAIRLVQCLLYLGTVYTTYRLGLELLGSSIAGLLAACLAAVPPVNVTLYTTVSLGGYGEALLIGNVLVLLGVRIARTIDLTFDRKSMGFHKRWFGSWITFYIFGAIAGIGLWANGLTLVYLVPACLFILYYFIVKIGQRSYLRTLLAFLVILGGFFTGSFPWWSVAIQSGFTALLRELFGSAVAVENGVWISQVLNHLTNFLLLGVPVIFGLRPPWEVRWLVLPLIPFVLFGWISIFYFESKKIIKDPTSQPYIFLLAGVPVMVIAGFLATPFGIDPSGRYFLPFISPLSLIAADIILYLKNNRWLSSGIFGIIVLFQLGGNIQSAMLNPPGLTTQFDATTIIDHRYDVDLINFLEAQGETVGYTNYWTSYPIAFLSRERVILVPKLPYHVDFRYTNRDDRYKPYDEMVASSQQVVYVTTRNPALDDRLRAQFAENDIQWKEKKIGDYQIFYRLSKVIRPDQMVLGLITNP